MSRPYIHTLVLQHGNTHLTGLKPQAIAAVFLLRGGNKHLLDRATRKQVVP